MEAQTEWQQLKQSANLQTLLRLLKEAKTNIRNILELLSLIRQQVTKIDNEFQHDICIILVTT